MWGLLDKELYYISPEKKELIKKAYKFCVKHHKGQKRMSGEPFFIHPVEVARILTAWRMDAVTIASALLHDVLEDTQVTVSDIKEIFGSEIAGIVETLSKMKKATGSAMKLERWMYMRRILIAMAEDLRVVFIKLADRLHNMRTLKYLDEAKRKKIARETLEVYAPLAHRLGMARLQWELEDLSLKFLQPTIYSQIENFVKIHRKEGEKFINQAKELIKDELSKAGIRGHVEGRVKNIYSIYIKMKKGKSLEEIYDIFGLRVIVGTEKECYETLGIVHSIWEPIPGRFKDYIASPKTNMYRSLHTTVIGPGGRPLEVQIRTWKMHDIAEYGIAAHWLYKEGKTMNKFEQAFAELQKSFPTNPIEFWRYLREEFFKDSIYVFTPKGDAVLLPEGATPIDFAYYVHSDIGNRIKAAKVNGRLVKLNYPLQNGDEVEIVVSPYPTVKEEWLVIAKTAKARNRIRNFLRSKGLLQEKKRKKAIPSSAPQLKTSSEGVAPKIVGAEGIPFHLAKCCNPLPPDPIVGYVSSGKRITVHRKGCPNISRVMDASRLVELSWGGDFYPARIKVVAYDRPGLLADVTAAISRQGGDILESRTFGQGYMAFEEFVVAVKDRGHLRAIKKEIERVKSVVTVE